MSEHCTRMDRLDATSYLETDQTTNVRFYQRFGYQVVGQEPVLGDHNLVHGTAGQTRPPRGRRVSC